MRTLISMNKEKRCELITCNFDRVRFIFTIYAVSISCLCNMHHIHTRQHPHKHTEGKLQFWRSRAENFQNKNNVKNLQISTKLQLLSHVYCVQFAIFIHIRLFDSVSRSYYFVCPCQFTPTLTTTKALIPNIWAFWFQFFFF